MGRNDHGARLGRRAFVKSVLATGVAAFVVPRRAAATTLLPGISLYRATFQNWSGELHADSLLTFAPESADDVVAVANWAAQHRYTLRPRGAMHNWSPLSIDSATTQATPLVMADMTKHLTTMAMVTDPQPAVRVGAGARLEDVMTFVERHGYGFTATPVVGDVTVGGMLAVNAHGCAVPATGEAPLPGQTFGTVSNRVLALQAVVWDEPQRRYVLRTFDRTDPAIGPLLTSLGRAFITSATLAVEPNTNLRCQSYVDIPIEEMCGPPGRGGRTIAHFLDTGGRIEMIWYPFTTNPWLKVWSACPTKPAVAREVTSPYNFPFTDSFPEPVVHLAHQAVTGNPSASVLLGQASYAATAAGLLATAAWDLWGTSKNLLLWLRESTLPVHHTSFVVLTRRDQVQRVCHEYLVEHMRLRDGFQAAGRYPMTMPVEIRVTGLDHAADLGRSGAVAPLISSAAPRSDHPDWDCAVWLSAATLPGSPGMFEFSRALEQWALTNYQGDYAAIRPEWSKGWAYTHKGAWSDDEVMHCYRDTFPGWDAAVRGLDALDPHRVFSNSSLDRLMVTS